MNFEARKDLILYDGVCGLCNGFVRFLLPRDRHDRLRFASLQSGFARDLLARHGEDARDLGTVYVVVNGRDGGVRLLRKSRAVLHVVRGLGGMWRVAALLAVCPPGLLDAGYDLVAKNRYRLFGKYEACLMPDPKWRDKFIDV